MMGSESGDRAEMGGFGNGVWQGQVGLGTQIGEMEFGEEMVMGENEKLGFRGKN